MRSRRFASSSSVLHAVLLYVFVLSILSFHSTRSVDTGSVSTDSKALNLPEEVIITVPSPTSREYIDAPVLITSAVLDASPSSSGGDLSVVLFLLSNDAVLVSSEDCIIPHISSTSIYKPIVSRVKVVSGLTMTRVQCEARGASNAMLTNIGHIEVKFTLGSISPKQYSVSIPTDTRLAGYLSNVFDARTIAAVASPPTVAAIASQHPAAHAFPSIHLIARCKLPSPPTRQSLIWLIEFVQHHISLGVEHIILGVPFRSTSSHFDRVFSLLISFVSSGHVSVVSLLDYMENALPFLRKVTSTPHVIKTSALTLFDNVMPMRARALSNFTSIWDTSKFIIPVAPSNNLIDVMKGFGPGISNRCFINIRTRVVLGQDIDTLENTMVDRPVNDLGGPVDVWIGEALGVSIWESRSIASRSGLVLNTLCDVLIAPDGSLSKCNDASGEPCCATEECKRTSMNTDGNSVLDQYVTYKHDSFERLNRLSSESSVARVSIMNEYTLRFFSANLDSLRSRGLLSYQLLPDNADAAAAIRPALSWKPYEPYFKSVKSGPKEILKSLRAKDIHAEEPIPRSDQVAVVNQIHESERKNGHTLVESLINVKKSSVNQLDVLPAYAHDFSEFFYGALIERKSNSVRLHLTTFMVCHLMTRDERFLVSIANEEKGNWTRLMAKGLEVKYHSSGLRKNNGVLTCRITPAQGEPSYDVLGHFVPNGLTPDFNANYLLDVLRCPIRDPRRAYERYRGTFESLEVHILRDGAPLIQYSVPWSSRRVGFMMDAPVGPRASTLDSWKGAIEAMNPAAHPTRSGRDKLHMCVPGMQSPLDRRVLPLFAEFFEHHHQLGVQHFHLVAAYMWNNKQMDRLLTAFRSYISEGVMSVTSHTSGRHAVEFNYVMDGVSYHRDPFKVIFSNMCLYYAKGMADYIAIWDFDEFFIPKAPHNSILDVIRTLENRPSHLAEDDSRALVELMPADHGGHPSCYILLNSEVVLNAGDKPNGIWIGEKFSHKSVKDGMSFQKPIFPTDTTFQASLHTGGTCMMKAKHAGCEVQCGDDAEVGASTIDLTSGVPHSCEFCYMKPEDDYSDTKVHRIDQSVLETDAHRANMTGEAMLYHIQFHRSYKQTNDPAVLSSKNDYALRYFDKVYQGLVDRGITILMDLPSGDEIARINASPNWIPLFAFMNSVQQSHNLGTSGASTVGTVDSAVSISFNEQLPKFSFDSSEYFLNAVIERSNSFDSLHLTTFFLGNGMFYIPAPTRSLQAYQVDPQRSNQWKAYIIAANNTKYDEKGFRLGDPSQYSCKIRFKDSINLNIKGHFIPNRLSMDANANRRVDILRCPLPSSFNDIIPSEASESNDKILVEIIRESDKASLVRFSFPLGQRRTGFMADTSPATGALQASRLDPWRGRGGARDNIHMCVPGIDSPPSRRLLSFLAEYIQHHLLLGIDHFHVGVRYNWGTRSMRHILQGLKPFIDEGQVSVTSMASEGINEAYSTSGIMIERDDCKVMFVNSCLYYAKGMADYVAIWDFDEYFIPKFPHNTILDLLKSLSEPFSLVPHDAAVAVDPLTAQQRWNGAAPGYATGDGHALCFFLLNSETLRSTEGEWMRGFDQLRWIGESYISEPERHDSTMNFKKSIIPTKTIFYTGLHVPGSCSLDEPFRGCEDRPLTNGFCMSTMKREFFGLSYLPNGTQVEFSTYHSFDTAVMDEDARIVDKTNEGVIYHIMMHRMNQKATLVGHGNDYANKFFRRVKEALQARGTMDIIDFPAFVPRGNDAIFSPSWTRFKEIMSEFSKKGYKA